MRKPVFTLLLALAASLPSVAHAQRRPGTVCPDPAHPCSNIKPYELSFVFPRDGVPRDEFRSDAFYAVILRSAPKCSIPERDRVAAQALFPGRKVFSQRFQCDDEVEDNITYTNVAENTAFLGVYAGATRAQALRVQEAARRRFPGANLRRMQVVLVYD